MKEFSWRRASGALIEYEDILKWIDNYIKLGGSVFIGTDSQIQKNGCTFVTAICLHGARNKSAYYFFRKFKEPFRDYNQLNARIMCEAQHSVDIATELYEIYPQANVEIHVDIGRSQRSATRNLVDAVKGWITGIGLKCKVKPNAWASSGVADAHTKNPLK